MYMFRDCPYAPKLWNSIWQYLSLGANKKFEVDIDIVMLCTNDKENEICTFISIIVK